MDDNLNSAKTELMLSPSIV